MLLIVICPDSYSNVLHEVALILCHVSSPSQHVTETPFDQIAPPESFKVRHRISNHDSDIQSLPPLLLFNCEQTSWTDFHLLAPG